MYHERLQERDIQKNTRFTVLEPSDIHDFWRSTAWFSDMMPLFDIAPGSYELDWLKQCMRQN